MHTNLGSLATETMKREVPPHLHDGLIRYFEHRIMPGGFLQAVLTNDLYGAIARADSQSLDGLPELVVWLKNHTPEEARGSTEKVMAWVYGERDGHESDGRADVNARNSVAVSAGGVSAPDLEA